ncbi:MAG: hypothetical protein Q9218_005956, partial [Villophora microphyllina]
MSLKRKRSNTTLPISPSSTSTISTPSRDTSPIAFHPNTHQTNSFSSPWQLPVQTPIPLPTCSETSSSNLHSRTKKRLRNNRPAEAEVFASTHAILFSPSRSSHPTIPHQNIAPHIHSQAEKQPAQRQTSLHNFWSLPTPPTYTPPSSTGTRPTMA